MVRSGSPVRFRPSAQGLPFFLGCVKLIPIMASKYSVNLIKLKCSVCNRVNYYTRKNKKLVERKIEMSKFCKWCRKHTAHKEAKR